MPTSPVEPTTKLSAPEHVLARRAAGETVLLSLDSEEYFGLDDVGSRAWELIETGTTLQALVGQLGTEYVVEPNQLEADLIDWIGALVEANLVVTDATS